MIPLNCQFQFLCLHVMMNNTILMNWQERHSAGNEYMRSYEIEIISIRQ